jgi:hypothetical protein
MTPRKPDGFFELRVPKQLLEKLEFDLARLRSSMPASRDAHYAAFDFFVGALHMSDWLSNTTGKPLIDFRNYPEFQIVSHIANGAKHFSVDGQRHSAVHDTVAEPEVFNGEIFDSTAFDTGRLVIRLNDGTIESAVEFAERVLNYWKTMV